MVECNRPGMWRRKGQPRGDQSSVGLSWKSTTTGFLSDIQQANMGVGGPRRSGKSIPLQAVPRQKPIACRMDGHVGKRGGRHSVVRKEQISLETRRDKDSPGKSIKVRRVRRVRRGERRVKRGGIYDVEYGVARGRCTIRNAGVPECFGENSSTVHQVNGKDHRLAPKETLMMVTLDSAFPIPGPDAESGGLKELGATCAEGFSSGSRNRTSPSGFDGTPPKTGFSGDLQLGDGDSTISRVVRDSARCHPPRCHPRRCHGKGAIICHDPKGIFL